MIKCAWSFVAKRAASTLRIVTDISVIGGIVVTGLVFFQDRQQSRIDATLVWLERFNAGQVLDARNKLYDFWRRQDRQILKGMTRDTLQAFVITEISRAPADAHEIPVVNVVEFFDSVQLCIEANICDAEALHLQLDQYGANLLCNYRGFILSQRDPLKGGLETFGNGLEAFVGPARSC